MSLVIDPLVPVGWGLLGVGEGEEEESGELRLLGKGEECFGVNGDSGDAIFHLPGLCFFSV